MADFADLITGYRRFRQNGWSHQRERWAELREGQSPRVMVIACSDSRVDPAQIFDASPGEIFSVRNIANLVPPFELGADIQKLAMQIMCVRGGEAGDSASKTMQ